MQYKQGPGEKPSKRRFGRLFTTKELYGVVQETRGSIAGIYATLLLITISVHVHVHVVHFSEVAVPKVSIRLTIAGLDVGNCLAKPGPVVVTIF